MLSWRGCRMSEERNVKKVFKNIPGGKRSVGKPRKRYLISDFHRAMNTDILALEFYTVCRLN
jgi:hypothetical protein